MDCIKKGVDVTPITPNRQDTLPNLPHFLSCRIFLAHLHYPHARMPELIHLRKGIGGLLKRYSLSN